MSNQCRVSFGNGADQSAAIAAAISMLRRDGVVVLDDLVDPARLELCKEEILAHHADIAVPDRSRYFGPYVGRHTIPLRVDRQLADQAILMPKPVAHIATELLDETFKIDSVGLLVAIPGAPDQAVHRDAWLYPKQGVDHVLAPFALAFALPLVSMDNTSGRTAFWRGSHRKPGILPSVDYDLAPTVHPGSAIMWDYRIHHCGLANHGPVPRPVIFSALSREWWVEIEPPEAKSYRKFQIARSVFDAFSPRWQSRCSRALLVE